MPRPTRGKYNAPVMIVCDAPTKAAMGERLPMELRQMQWVAPLFEREGISPKSDVFMVGLCPPVPQDAKNSASRKWKHVEPFVEGVNKLIEDGQPSLIITLGELASRAVLGRAVKITKARGQVVVRDDAIPVFPMLSPGFVDRIPDHRATFEADVHTVGMLSRAGFDPDQVQRTETNYEWRTDISDLLGENKPATIAVDTEGTGLRWWDENVELISVQISTGPGHAVVCPVDAVYWKRWLEDDLGKCTKVKIRRLVSQLKELLEDPDVNKIGQNHKFDHHHIRKLGIEVQNWLHDTNIMGFAVDENMLSLGLDELTRVYVPEMSGYADCVSLDAMVLTDDMRKVRAEDLQVGDNLCAFTAETEGGKAQRRKMRRSTVVKMQRLRRSCLRVTTASGRSTVVSKGHLFLCKRGLSDKGGGWRWRQADSLKVGSVLKPFPWEDPVDDFDAGYVSGVLDGEGWLQRGRSRVGVSQRDNVVLKKFRCVVTSHGIVPSHSTDKRKKVPVVNDTFDGHACFKILQKFRPLRLLEDARWEGCGLPTNGNAYDPVVSVEPLGEQDVIGLETSTQTIIADGLLSHNSFNRDYDKSDMRSVPPDDFLLYAGGDPDATFRLARVLQGRMRMDPPQQRVYQRIQMPATACFMNVSEPYGLRVDVDHLRDFGEEVREWLIDEYRELIRMVPARVRRKHLNAGKECSFTRPEFVQDVLFGVDGFGLESRVWTKGTMDLQNVSERVPSTSAKDHMPYFVNETRMVRDDVTVGDFVTRLIEYKKTVSLENHFIGWEMDPKKEEPTGLWKYLSSAGFIHPSFGVTVANTGRTNSRDPNSQNFPKRGSRFAKMFGRIFIPRDGYVFVACDLSQIELRVAAWMAGERTMLQVFLENGDIHSKTAASTMGITLDEFSRLDEDVRVLKRFQAKAINFGFIFGMWWRGFMQYAKVEFGVDLTEDEAKSFRETFFETYDCIEPWHNTMKNFAHEHGYVAALHGAVRHLPMIKSRDEAMMKQAERYAINSPVQRFGSDLGLIAFIRFSQRADPELMRVVNFIHDQTFLEAREDYAEEAASALRWCMQNPPLEEWFGITSPVPITSDVEMGHNAGAMEEVDIEARRPEWW